MRHLNALCLILALAAAPLAAAAQDAESGTGDQGDLREGFDLFSEGTKRMLRLLLEELEPSLRDLQRDLNGAFDTLDRYHPPEVLPNGDIIIRRKTEDELPEPVEPGDSIEL